MQTDNEIPDSIIAVDPVPAPAPAPVAPVAPVVTTSTTTMAPVGDNEVSTATDGYKVNL